MEMTMEGLENCFYFAKENGYRYVALLIVMEGFAEPEVIINGNTNFDKKLEYLKKAYDDGLNHKFSKGVKIIGHTYGDNYDEIEEELIGGLV